MQNRQLLINDNGVDATALVNAMIVLDTDNATDETDVRQPPKLKPDDWDTWEPEFLNYVKSLQGEAGALLDHIV